MFFVYTKPLSVSEPLCLVFLLETAFPQIPCDLLLPYIQVSGQILIYERGPHSLSLDSVLFIGFISQLEYRHVMCSPLQLSASDV